MIYTRNLDTQPIKQVNRRPDSPGTGSSKMPEEDRRRRYTANLQGEVDSAALYKTLAQTEKNPQLAQVYQRLAAIEEARGHEVVVSSSCGLGRRTQEEAREILELTRRVLDS